MLGPLTTQLVGSYVKPEWLVRHDRLLRFDDSAWRLGGELLAAARADAIRLAVYEQERAGLDLLTDGEVGRAAFDRYFYARLRGIDASRLHDRPDHLGEVPALQIDPRRSAERKWHRTHVPRITGAVEWPGPLSVEDVRFLKRHTDRPVKATIIGPLTALDRLADHHYGDERAAAMALADALNAEMRALEAEGVALLQVDEPAWHYRLSRARTLGRDVIERLTRGLKTPVAVHVCYGYAYFATKKEAHPGYAEALALLADCPDIAAVSLEYEQPGHGPELLRHLNGKDVILGLLDLSTHDVETPEHVGRRLRDALAVVPPERLHPAPDCGMWHLPRDVAYAKLAALVQGTQSVRRELGLFTAR
jgi:5-methyltetrahydropteroyltriglutamate--homocysteine methyltransferase